mmetsp:Transcript_4610/g.5004  ORF Transcript_4610/g.5004 Transcript_4610/m.5004 type:complete len:542 (+) Transcript_4610:95-1720(+)|eukprot:CAMPEP_0168529262 /NCGR_PEP_ID=MMETSP0405-20121227/13793_1 /TAXON_ID=498012 /ORGANISM="Trichosphaerium sp, Strain Am-I-7 wt" /LENGTH=541 /DNA_ID=CAMNT_0008552931 /DNA_START=31 /DNA_END=1656 /DNA_ORIENTATION=-
MTEPNETPPYKPLPFQPSNAEKTIVQPDPAQQGPPEIPDDEINYDDSGFLGKGAYGYVYKGTCRNKTVAIKVPKESLPPSKLEQFRQEVQTMRRIFHPNVVLFMGANTSGGKIKIITELCSTDVEKLLRSKKNLPLKLRLLMAKGAALGMNWLHGIVKMVHRDLKTANLLVAADGTVKVADFGFGKVFEAGKTFRGRAKGTPLWMAPEVMLGKPTDERRDVYSFGIILWEFITGEEPFQQFSDWHTFKTAVAVNHVRPEIPAGTLPCLKYLIECCWQPSFTDRPSFAEVIFRLNEAIVDCAIEDKRGKEFWKKYFLINKQDLQLEVPWDEFKTALQKEIGLTSVECLDETTSPDCLKEFLCLAVNIPKLEIILKEEEDAPKRTKYAVTPADPVAQTKKVTLETFNFVMQWFGPFITKQDGRQIINMLHNVKHFPWFHGYISSGVAVERLENRDPGTFLVRLSITSPGKPLTLSVMVTSGDRYEISHRRIIHKKYGEPYIIRISNKEYSYETIPQLIEGCRGLLKLTKACDKRAGRLSNYIF